MEIIGIDVVPGYSKRRIIDALVCEVVDFEANEFHSASDPTYAVRRTDVVLALLDELGVELTAKVR